MFVPESPYYLIAKKEQTKAKEVIKLLDGGDDSAIDTIVEDIEKYIERGKSSDITRSLESTNSVQMNKVIDPELLEIQPEKDVAIIDIYKATQARDPFLEKSEKHPGGSSCCNQTMIKIVLIVAGLFLFTRLCGKLCHALFMML